MERLVMASALELAPPVQQIQYPAKRFLAPLPLSLFGEFEDESNGSVNEQSASAPNKGTPTPTSISTTTTTSPADLVSGDDDDEFGDFESEFGDFESVPAGTTQTSFTSEPPPNLQPDLHLPQELPEAGIGRPAVVTHDFLADFGAVPVAPNPPPAPAPTRPKSRPVVEEDLFGNFEAVPVSPALAPAPPPGPAPTIMKSRPVVEEDLFANFEAVPVSPAPSPAPAPTIAKSRPVVEEDLFGDFEAVPVFPAPSPAPAPTITKSRPVVEEDLFGNFEAMPVAPAPAPTITKSRPVVEKDLFANFEAGTGVPQIEVSHTNRPVYDFFADFESPTIPQPTNFVTKKLAQDTPKLFDDFSSLSVNRTHHFEPSSATASSADGFESFGPGAVKTVQIEPSAVKPTSVSMFDDFGFDSFDVPKRGPMNGFEDLFGDFKAPPPVITQSPWGFANKSQENSLESKSQNIVANGSEHPGFDPLGVFQFDPEAKSGSRDVIFFSPKAELNGQGNGGESDDDWGDFVAPPPPVTLPTVNTSETVSNDPSIGIKDPISNGEFRDLSDFSVPDKTSQSQDQTQHPGFIDAWEAYLVDSGTGKSNSADGESTAVAELDTSSQSSAKSVPVKIDASSFYEAQVFQFFPTTGSTKPHENGASHGPDSRRSRSVDLDALYASPSPVVKTHTRGKSYVEHHSAAPLSLSLFGEEEDAGPEAAEVSLGSSLNDFVGSGQHHDANGDEFPGGVSSSSDSQEDDVDADEFFLASADDLHKLTLWLLEEGRVQEALACTSHTAALLEFQALQEDCSRALESGDKAKAAVITTKIEAAHAKLVKPQEWHRWQKRQRHENGFKHGSTPIIPKLTHEDMMSLLGGTSDPRGEYFRSHFQSDEIDSLAKKDLRATAEHHTRAIETFHLLISATVQEQLLYVKAWSALASSCASELELGMIFWQRAVQTQSQSHLLTHRQGRNYFAALGQVYSVFLVLEATVRLHAPWLEVAGEKGKAVHRLIDECRTCWLGSGLKDAVYWALSDANESLPSTRTSWQGILDLSIAVNLASLKHFKAGIQPVCGLSLLPLQTLPGLATVEWGGRQYFLPLANMWANCVENEPPRLPVMGLQQSV